MDIDGSQKARWGFTSDRVFNIDDPASYPTTLSLAIGTAKDIEGHFNGGVFAQDTWQVRNNLTLNLGLRYDVDNSILTGDQFVDGYNDRFVKSFGGSAPLNHIKRDLNNLAPRLGLVWLPTASRRTPCARVAASSTISRTLTTTTSTSIRRCWRSGGIIQLERSDEQPVLQRRRSGGERHQASRFSRAEFSGLARLLATRSRRPVRQRDGVRLPDSVHGPDDGRRDPRHRLPLLRPGRLHPLPRQGCGVVEERQRHPGERQLRDDRPRFGGFTLFQNLGWIHYDALQTRAEYRAARAKAGRSYTLSKTFSNTLATGVGGGAATNPLDLSIDEGPANEDRRHNLVFDGSYELPLGFPAGRNLEVYAAPCHGACRARPSSSPGRSRAVRGAATTTGRRISA